MTTDIPDGWQLVPKEPTPEMRMAYHAVVDSTVLGAAGSRWAAMLSAAPSSPSAPAEPADGSLRWRLAAIAAECSDMDTTDALDKLLEDLPLAPGDGQVYAAVSAAAGPAAQGGERERFEAAMVEAGYHKPERSPFGSGDQYKYERDQDRFAGWQLALATPAPASPCASPAAAANLPLSRDDLELMRQWFDNMVDVNPAYVTPDDRALAVRLYQALGMRPSNSLLQSEAKPHASQPSAAVAGEPVATVRKAGWEGAFVDLCIFGVPVRTWPEAEKGSAEVVAHKVNFAAPQPFPGAQTNGLERSDETRLGLHGRVPVGVHAGHAMAGGTLPSLSDKLWNSNEVMELNAELGLRMDQLVRLASAITFALAPSPGAQGSEAVEENEELHALNAKLADLLTRSINAVRGAPPPLTAWSWHDLPDRIAATMAALQGALELAAAPACGLSEEQEREAFEASRRKLGWEKKVDENGTPLLARHEHGKTWWGGEATMPTYRVRWTEAQWLGWLARARLTHPDATKETP